MPLMILLKDCVSMMEMMEMMGIVESTENKQQQHNKCTNITFNLHLTGWYCPVISVLIQQLTNVQLSNEILLFFFVFFHILESATRTVDNTFSTNSTD